MPEKTLTIKVDKAIYDKVKEAMGGGPRFRGASRMPDQADPAVEDEPASKQTALKPIRPSDTHI